METSIIIVIILSIVLLIFDNKYEENQNDNDLIL